MEYRSTRENATALFASQAIIKGISKDGGLFVPSRFPDLRDSLEKFKELDYKQLAAEVMGAYLDEFDKDTLLEYAEKAYSRYDCKEVVPVKKLSSGIHMLELWHGPTMAFKDMALQMLPLLLTGSLKIQRQDKNILILVATSGDTGKAALEGFCDVEHTGICVFYPHDGVSKAQKLQMVTQDGNNVMVSGIYGNFDDAQTGVKTLFADEEFNSKIEEVGYSLSSANSINWGRLLPQIVYYFWGYLDLVRKGSVKIGDKINVCVPTGNFGNILAAYYAKQMGLPVGTLICASNVNNVLTDFFKTGTYCANREFYKTNSPSMDILISSNLERLLYHFSGENDKEIKRLMADLKEKGEYTVSGDIKDKMDKEFFVGYCNEQATLDVINTVFDEQKYLMDTHTAVAYDVVCQYKRETGDDAPCLVASTASPYKFSASVVDALDYPVEDDVFKNAEKIEEVTGVKIPEPLLALKNKDVRFNGICSKEDMAKIVLDWIKNNG